MNLNMVPRILDPDTQFERENVILDCALSFIDRESAATLTIDKLVKDLPFSKGTVYNHFNGKEDLLLGLCNRSMRMLAKMFARAYNFDGNPRERILAIHFAYMLYAKLYPSQFMLVLTAKTVGVTEKASIAQQNEHLQLETKLIGPSVAICEQAIEQGLLKPPMGMGLEQIAFAGWSLSFGINALLLSNFDRCNVSLELSVERELVNGVNVLLDGLRFKPFSDEFDWSVTIEKLKSDTFANEVKQLAATGITLSV